MDIGNDRIVVLMRHGERIDDNIFEKHKQILPLYDPELTQIGINQAKNIGKQLLSNLPKLFNKTNTSIKVYTSPFTRTIQTAVAFIESIPHATVQLEINEGLSELFGIGQFKADPIPNLLCNNKKKKEYGQLLTLLNNTKALKMLYKKNDLLKYPECFNESIERYNYCAKEIMESIMNSEEDLSLIVTHGYGVLALNEVFSLGSVDETLIDFCSTFVYDIKKNGFEYYNMMNPY